MPSSWLRAATSASWPAPPRSCRRKVKPLALPSSGIGGGLSGKMKASRTPDSAPKARPASACAESPSPLRSSQSLSVTKARPAFWPWPEKLKPSTPTMLCTSGCLRMKPSTCFMTSSVRSCVAPGGSCTLTMMLPWSSLRQEGGRHAQEREHHDADDGRVDHQVAHGAAQDARHQAFVALGGAREAAVEPAEEAASSRGGGRPRPA